MITPSLFKVQVMFAHPYIIFIYHIKSAQIPPISDLCPILGADFQNAEPCLANPSLVCIQTSQKIIDLVAIRICLWKEEQMRDRISIGCLCCVYSH